MTITNRTPSSVAPLIVPDSSRPVAGVAFLVVAAIVIAAILAQVTGIMDLSGMMEGLFTPTTTPPPFAPSAS